MTIETAAFKTVVNGNGSATSFSFNPVVLYADGQLNVFMLDNLGNQTLLVEGTSTGNYGIVVSGGYPGTGSITYPNDGVSPPLPTGWSLYIYPNFPLVQTLGLDNQGGYLPKNQEQALDYLTMLILQLQAEINLCLQVPPTSTIASSTLVGDIVTLSGLAAQLVALTTVAADILALGPEAANISTVAGIAASVTAVAGVSADVVSAANSQFRFTLGASTSMTVNPGSGVVNGNSATFNSVTEFNISQVTANLGGGGIANFLATVGSSTSAIKGYALVFDLNHPGYFAIFSVTGASALVAGQSCYTVPVSWISGNLGSVVQPGDTLSVQFLRTGDAGSGVGTVTSIQLTLPGILTGGATITTNGTFAVDLATQNKNLVLVSDASSNGQKPTFRALVAADLPTVSTASSAPSYTAAQMGVG